ncbi:transposase [Halomonas sp. YLB-10]
MTKKTRRRYSDEFEADAVRLVTEQGYSVSEAARRLGVDRSLMDR